MTSRLNRNNPKHILPTLLIALGSLMPALAQIPMATEPFDRVGKTEIYGIGQYLHSDDLKFNGPAGDVNLKMDDTGLGGFGIAYHFNDFISVHADFMFGGATFTGDIPLGNAADQQVGTFHVNQNTFIQTGRFNVDYNIINRRITPFLTAGIGYQYIETELEHLPPVGYCYWDPWWGWVCYSGQPHAWQTDFTWNVGGGFRWNITDNIFIKATVGATWLEYSGTHGVTTQLEGIFGIGWSF